MRIETLNELKELRERGYTRQEALMIMLIEELKEIKEKLR